MPLEDLDIFSIIGRVRGAYVDEPGYQFQGEDGFTGLQEILQYIFDNLGGEGGNDRYLEDAQLDGTNLTLTLNDATEITVDLSSLANTDDYVTAAALIGSTLRLTRVGGATIDVDLSSLSGGGGGGGLLQYEADPVNDPTDNGCFITTTVAGATYERTGGAGQNTEGIVTLPAASIPRGLSVHFSAGQAPGNTFYLNVDYTGTGKAVNGAQNSVMPPLATVTSKPGAFSDGAPATNYVHSGTPLQVGIAQVDDNGSRVRVRYKITNYNQQVGANASILTFIFP